MKSIVMTCTIILLLGSVAFAAKNLEQQVLENQQRIRQLEEGLAEIQDALEDLRNQSASSPPVRTSLDPLVGKWDCTNNLYNYEIYFDAKGRMMQQEAVLGDVKINRWGRIDKNEIVLADGLRLRTEFESQDELTVENIKSRAVWTCTRITE